MDGRVLESESLTDYQRRVQARLADVAPVETELCLPVQAGTQHWLFSTHDIVKVVLGPVISKVPGAQAPILGLSSYEGQIYTVFDFNAVLGLPKGHPSSKQRVVFLAAATDGASPVALLVDRCLDCIPLPPLPATQIGSPRRFSLGRLATPGDQEVYFADCHALTHTSGAF